MIQRIIHTADLCCHRMAQHDFAAAKVVLLSAADTLGEALPTGHEATGFSKLRSVLELEKHEAPL